MIAVGSYFASLVVNLLGLGLTGYIVGGGLERAAAIYAVVWIIAYDGRDLRRRLVAQEGEG